MNKILVVTYSFTGTAARLSELLCRSRAWTAAPVVEASALGARHFALCAGVRTLTLSPEAAG